MTAAGGGNGGLWLMAQAAIWFSVMSVLVKLVGGAIPVLEIVFVRALVTLVLSGGWLLRARISPWGQRRRLLLLRGLLGSGGLICFYTAVVHLPLAEVTVIHQTSPLLTALLAAWWLGERLEGRVVASVLASFTGVVLIARPGWAFGGDGASFDPVFAFVALGGALFSAGAYVTVRRLGASENPLVVVFYFPLVTIPLILPLVVRDWVWPSPWEWAMLLGVGVTTQLAQVALTKGLARERAGRATSMGYLQVALATLWGVLVFGDLPDGWSIGGAAIILISLLAVARR